MKSQIFLYLFLFALLLLIFQFVNSKHILDNYEVQIRKSEAKVQQYKDSIVVLQHEVVRLKKETVSP